MELKDKCRSCGSHRWCGRQCVSAPPRQPLAPVVSRAVVDKPPAPKREALVPRSGDVEGRAGYNAFMREYMREYRKRKKGAK